MLTLECQILNVIAKKGGSFTDKDTGEVRITKDGHVAQLQWMEENKGVKKIIMKDINVKGMGEHYLKLVGKRIRVQVGIYESEQTKRPELYIPEGSIPMAVAA
ncbi:MAG: hypothetical protein WCI39_07030 [Gallionellaceae bacterium]